MTNRKNPLVSVIVPVYNVEAWLPACLDCLRAQSYGHLDIILVDDGSTDGSGALCDAFAAEDARVTLVRQENGGLSEARNAGVRNAKGDYVLFLDSDDFMDADTVERMVGAAVGSDADVVATGFVYAYGDREEPAASAFGKDVCMDARAAVKALVSGKIPNFAWGKLIRTAVARCYAFPKGKLFEDHYWTHLILGESSRTVWMEEIGFHYRQREGSISYTYTPDRLQMLDGWRRRIAYLQERYPDLTDTYLDFLAGQFPGVCWLVLTRLKGSKKYAFACLRSFSTDHSLAEHAGDRDAKMIRALERSDAAYALAALTERMRQK